MIKPIRNQLVFKPFLTDNITKSGFIIPDSCRKESSKGEIVAVGAGTVKTPMQFKGGEIVFRVKDWGTPFQENGETFYLMEQADIRAILKK